MKSSKLLSKVASFYRIISLLKSASTQSDAAEINAISKALMVWIKTGKNQEILSGVGILDECNRLAKLTRDIAGGLAGISEFEQEYNSGKKDGYPELFQYLANPDSVDAALNHRIAQLITNASNEVFGDESSYPQVVRELNDLVSELMQVFSSVQSKSAKGAEAVRAKIDVQSIAQKVSQLPLFVSIMDSEQEDELVAPTLEGAANEGLSVSGPGEGHRVSPPLTDVQKERLSRSRKLINMLNSHLLTKEEIIDRNRERALYNKQRDDKAYDPESEDEEVKKRIEHYETVEKPGLHSRLYGEKGLYNYGDVDSVFSAAFDINKALNLTYRVDKAMPLRKAVYGNIKAKLSLIADIKNVKNPVVSFLTSSGDRLTFDTNTKSINELKAIIESGGNTSIELGDMSQQTQETIDLSSLGPTLGRLAQYIEKAVQIKCQQLFEARIDPKSKAVRALEEQYKQYMHEGDKNSSAPMGMIPRELKIFERSVDHIRAALTMPEVRRLKNYDTIKSNALSLVKEIPLLDDLKRLTKYFLDETSKDIKENILGVPVGEEIETQYLKYIPEALKIAKTMLATVSAIASSNNFHAVAQSVEFKTPLRPVAESERDKFKMYEPIKISAAEAKEMGSDSSGEITIMVKDTDRGAYIFEGSEGTKKGQENNMKFTSRIFRLIDVLKREIEFLSKHTASQVEGRQLTKDRDARLFPEYLKMKKEENFLVAGMSIDKIIRAIKYAQNNNKELFAGNKFRNSDVQQCVEHNRDIIDDYVVKATRLRAELNTDVIISAVNEDIRTIVMALSRYDSLQRN